MRFSGFGPQAQQGTDASFGRAPSETNPSPYPNNNHWVWLHRVVTQPELARRLGTRDAVIIGLV